MKWVMKQDNNNEDDNNIVDLEGCHLYFVGEINQKTATEFIRMVRQFEKSQSSNKALGLNAYDTLYVHINNNGGTVTDGLACYDVLRNASVNVVTIAEGLCASAATFVLLGSDTRQSLPNTSFLIHQLSGWQYGTFAQMEDDYKWSKQLMVQIVNVYKRHLTLSDDEIQSLLSRDSWLDVQGAIAIGLLTE